MPVQVPYVGTGLVFWPHYQGSAPLSHRGWANHAQHIPDLVLAPVLAWSPVMGERARPQPGLRPAAARYTPDVHFCPSAPWQLRGLFPVAARMLFLSLLRVQGFVTGLVLDRGAFSGCFQAAADVGTLVATSLVNSWAQK